MRVIFVCTGNTCRSPMAEKIFRSMVEDKNLVVESRGVMCRENMPMALNARVVMTERGLSTDHKSKSLTMDDIESADYIITMTRDHKEYINALYGDRNNIRSMDEFTHQGDVDDPYGGDIFVYRKCAEKLTQNLEIVKNKLFGSKVEDKPKSK